MLAFEVVSDGAGEQKVADERFRFNAMAMLVVMLLQSVKVWRIVSKTVEGKQYGAVSYLSLGIVPDFEGWRARNDA